MEQPWKPTFNPWLIAIVVAMAAFMEVLDTSIANVALPHMAGNLGASNDESTWVLTSYLVSNAIILPISGWLATQIGRKRFYMLCVTLFGISTRNSIMLISHYEHLVEEDRASWSIETVARGAGRFGASHMLSSVSEPGLEKTAQAAPDALRFYQLYVRGDDAFVEDVVSRTISNGYAAFCLTVDTAHYSRRERDIAKRYVRESRLRATGGDFQKGLEWRTVKLIKDKFRIPLVIKGIATAEDAKIALDHGVDWIYVSNHGGRQLDHGRGAMHVLPEIVNAVAGRAKIMVDGSFCRGTDIVKAIASGADLVGIGRLQCWALAAAGEEGIVRMLELLEDEVIRCLGLLGVTSFRELDKSYLYQATATNLPSVFSAFPLLDIEPYRY